MKEEGEEKRRICAEGGRAGRVKREERGWYIEQEKVKVQRKAGRRKKARN
jgi:hypothetical protein